MRNSILSISVASVLIFSGEAFAKTASCPCKPSCPCSPCTCGAGGPSKSGGGSKHHDKEHGHDHHGGGSSVGVGGNVDLGGVLQRKTEGNPFPTGGGEKPVTHTEEKKTTKKPEQRTPTTFDKIELTSEKAKEVEPSDKPPGSEGGQTYGGGGINVSNDTPTPGPGTQEKKKKVGKKKKKKWPKPIQDWVDKMHAAEDANEGLKWAQGDYQTALIHYCDDKSAHWRELRDACREAQNKAAAEGATQADKDNADKICKEKKQLEEELGKDFSKTDDGKKAGDKLNDAQKAADKANGEEKEAGKNIDQGTKDSVKQYEKDHPPVTGTW